MLFLFLCSCTGSKKYFKAAEKLEKEGLVNEAAGFYMESLERKPNNTKARIKLKEVGQKYVNNLSSKFFREYNSGELDQSIETFDKLKAFTSKGASFNVELNYPQAYNADYENALDKYLNRHYENAYKAVNQNNFDVALKEISKIKKYNPDFKRTQELEITSVCEPLYLAIIRDMENKNYESANSKLEKIIAKKVDYKDAVDLKELLDGLLKINLMIIKPKTADGEEKNAEEHLFNQFTQECSNLAPKLNLINNSPFLIKADIDRLSNSGSVDLLQGIRKATGVNYYYIYDVSNIQVNEPKSRPVQQIAFQQVTEKRNNVMVTECVKVPYQESKLSRNYSYEFKYRLINANSNQLVFTNTENCSGKDAVEYAEFSNNQINTNNLSSIYPYDPCTTPAVNQFNPNQWRKKFSEKRELKNTQSLKKDADAKAISLFNSTLNSNLIKR